MNETHNRLSIYRFLTLDSGPLKYFSGEENFSFESARLGEEIYSWATTVNIWDGIADEQVRARMRDWLSGFNGSSQEGRQNIEDLCIFLEQLEVAVQRDAWISATSTRSIGGSNDFDSELRILPALTFAQHLRWICETFSQTPDLMVVYR